jgi:hypothetical protein
MREADQPHEEGSRCLYANQHPWRTWQRHEDGEEATFIKKHRGRIIVFFEDDHGPLIYPIRLKRYEKIK